MKRRDFLQTMVPMGLLAGALPLSQLGKLSESFKKSDKMPALFLGHGSPMNAIEENEFVHGFRNVVKSIPTPNAILCISAHWETRGTKVTAMSHPKTIHDFGGFPQALFDVQYPAPGSPELAHTTKEIVTSREVELDDKWGLDHGAWSVIKHMYPDANIPVVQMSLDVMSSPAQHYALAQELNLLRERGILIIGSGNLVHNLRMVAWDKLNQPDYGFDWALEAKTKMNQFIMNNDFKSLINYKELGKAFQLSIPTPEHYLPLIYTMGMLHSKDEISLFNDKAIGGSLTMTSVKLG